MIISECNLHKPPGHYNFQFNAICIFMAEIFFTVIRGKIKCLIYRKEEASKINLVKRQDIQNPFSFILHVEILLLEVYLQVVLIEEL